MVKLLIQNGAVLQSLNEVNQFKLFTQLIDKNQEIKDIF